MTTLYGHLVNEVEKEPINNLAYMLLDKMQNIPNAIGTAAGFYKNYIDMNNTPSMYNKDKYLHAKANFNAGKHYDFPTAMVLDIGREFYDIPAKTWGKKKNGRSFQDNVYDSLEDLYADFYGLGQGALHPFGNPKVLLDKYRPEELDTRY